MSRLNGIMITIAAAVQDKGKLLVVTARRRYTDSSDQKPILQFNMSNSTNVWHQDPNQKVLMPTKFSIKRDRASTSAEHVAQLINEGLPMVMENGPVIREMVKAAGLDTAT